MEKCSLIFNKLSYRTSNIDINKHKIKIDCKWKLIISKRKCSINYFFEKEETRVGFSRLNNGQ